MKLFKKMNALMNTYACGEEMVNLGREQIENKILSKEEYRIETDLNTEIGSIESVLCMLAIATPFVDTYGFVTSGIFIAETPQSGIIPLISININASILSGQEVLLQGYGTKSLFSEHLLLHEGIL